MLELVDLGKSFDGVSAINGVSFDVGEDEYLTLLGPSGSGKTVLLRLIAGLDRPDAGRIVLNGQNITNKPTHLRGLGFVQQKYALFPHLSVRQNISFGLTNHHSTPISDANEVNRLCDEMLEIVGLSGLADRGVGQISGGQKQRVSLARTLVTKPKLCLLDEPLGALDANLRERMTVELRDIRARLGVSFMHVTGNEDEALGMGDRMIVLDKGSVIQIEKPADVFSRPATVSVARHMNNYNILPGSTRNNHFVFAGSRLSIPANVENAAFYVVGIDKVAVEPVEAPERKDAASIDATYVASEFMGSRVVYLFERQDGQVFEVERHLSRETPVNYIPGETRRLSWDVNDVLTYAPDGSLVNNSAQLRGAA